MTSEVVNVGFRYLRENCIRVVRFNESINFPLKVRAQIVLGIVQAGCNGLKLEFSTSLIVMLSANGSQTTLGLRA